MFIDVELIFNAVKTLGSSKEKETINELELTTLDLDLSIHHINHFNQNLLRLPFPTC